MVDRNNNYLGSVGKDAVDICSFPDKRFVYREQTATLVFSPGESGIREVQLVEFEMAPELAVSLMNADSFPIVQPNRATNAPEVRRAYVFLDTDGGGRVERPAMMVLEDSGPGVRVLLHLEVEVA